MSRLMPPVFDPEFYRSSYSDLKAMTWLEAAVHYESFGLKEGRLGSCMQLRESFLSLVNSDLSTLEIGPFNSPALSGTNISYFDVDDKETLNTRAAEHGMPTDRTPAITFVSPTGDLGIIDRPFEQVFSSHCIEHQPDLVKHLQGVSRILGGGIERRLYMVVPDKRFCFDHFIPTSSIADVLGAYLDKRHLHASASIISHLCMTTHNDPFRHWAGDHGSMGLTENPSILAAGYAHANQSLGVYRDSHAWQFTPDSLNEIIVGLNALNLIDLEVERIYPTPLNQFEFTIVLRKVERISIEWA